MDKTFGEIAKNAWSNIYKLKEKTEQTYLEDYRRQLKRPP